MKTYNTGKKFLVLCFAVPVFLQSPLCHGGVKKIPPETFTSLNPGVQTFVSPEFIAPASIASAATFVTPLKLRPGAKIRKVLYYHWADAPGTTSVALYRTKMGASFDTASPLLRAVVQDQVAPLWATPLMVENAPPDPASDLTVRKGYRYFLLATCSNGSQKIGGVKVRYR